MERLSEPTVIPIHTYIIAMAVMNGVTALVVAVRLFTHWGHYGKWLVDDYLSVLALAFTASYSGSNVLILRAFESNPDDVDLAQITVTAAVSTFAGTAALYFTKMPILILIMRLFGIRPWVRYTDYFIVVFLAICFPASAMWTGVHCSPNLHPVHDGNYVLACVSAAYYTSVARGSLSLAADLVIFVMPLPLVAKLKLSRQRKLSVFLVFFTGSFGIAAAVWSLYYKFAHQAVLNSSTIANFQISTVIECCVCLVVGCAAALHLSWTSYLSKTWLATRLSISTPNIPKSGEGPNISPRINQHQIPKSDEKHDIAVPTHAHIEHSIDAPQTGSTIEPMEKMDKGSDSDYA